METNDLILIGMWVCIFTVAFILYIRDQKIQEAKILKQTRKNRLYPISCYDYLDEADNAVSSLANELNIPLQSDLDREEEQEI